MSGESIGGIAVIAAMPIVITGVTIYGIASVVKSLAEQEKANREAQRLRIEREAGQFRMEAQKELEIELNEIEDRKRKRVQLQAQRESQESARNRRLKEIAGRERVASAMSSITMSQLDALKQNLSIKLERHTCQIADIRDPKLRTMLKDESGLIKDSLAHMMDQDCEIIQTCIEEFGRRICGIKECGYDPIEKQRIVGGLIAEIETDIECLPQSYSKLIEKDVIQIRECLEGLKRTAGANYAFSENLLKGLKQRLAEGIRFAEKKREADEKLLSQSERELKELLLDLDAIMASTEFSGRKKAASFRESLTKLYLLDDVSEINRELQRIRPEIKNLYAEYLEEKKNDLERIHIMNEVQEILTDMGYKAQQIHTAGSNKYRQMQFQIPGGEAVRLGLSLDKKFSAQLFHPEDSPDTNAEAFRRQEEKFCSHLPKLRERLKARGLLYTIQLEKKIHDSVVQQMVKPKKKRRADLRERRVGE